MTTLREEARAWVRRALGSSFPEQDLEEYGDSLFAIAEKFKIPDETLIFWIQDKPKWKEFSLTAFTRYCAGYAQLAAQVGVEVAEPTAEQLLARDVEKQRLCTTCFSHVVLSLGNGRWWCQKCGEVQP